MRVDVVRRRVFAFVFLLSFAATIVARAASPDSPDGMWLDLSLVDLNTIPAKDANPDRFVHPTTFRPVWLDEALLDDLLQFAPMEKIGEHNQYAKNGLSIWLPMPDGTNTEFALLESPIMEPELAVKYPYIKTYSGRSLDGRDLYARFDRTPQGFHAIVLGGQTTYIDPYSKEGVYATYYAGDYSRGEDAWGCEVPDSDLTDEAKGGGGLVTHGNTLRTYRLAVACSGEYANYHNATSLETLGNALSAVTTTVNRIDGIYETEISVRLVLVANNDLILFWVPATDPFDPTGSIGTMLNQSQFTINAIIGAANYDIGHTFAIADKGGLANLACVCDANKKAGAVTTRLAPIGDPFDVDYVSHEIGHQFGAEHTFNSTRGGCKGNRAKKSAYERGAGTTIMSYAGICGKDDITANSAPMFHSQSLGQIQDFLDTATCAVSATTGNTGPDLDAGLDYTIPKQTPFMLTAMGVDTDGDLITYSWEERDLGPAQKITDPDNGKSPLFRGYFPKGENYRIFPRLEFILDGKQNGNKFELLPSLSRTMTFWVVGRDAHGGFGSDTAHLTVSANAGPFKVTYPNSAVTIKGGSKKKVKWEVAKTDMAPVSTPNVRILLSTDGGQTFPTVLKASTPNDGAQKIKFPQMATLTGRVKIEGIDSIFFDISDKNFAIDGGFSIVGTWLESGSATAYRWVFDSNGTYTRCFPPNYTDCLYNGEPKPYSFEETGSEPHPWQLLTVSDERWCEIVDNNTIDTYYRFGENDVFEARLTRQ